MWVLGFVPQLQSTASYV